MGNSIYRKYKSRLTTAFLKSLIDGDRSFLNSLSQELEIEKKKYKAPIPKIMTALEDSLSTPEIDMRSATEIITDAKKKDRAIIAHSYYHPERDIHLDAIQRTNKLISNLKVDNRPYNPRENLTSLVKITCGLALTCTVTFNLGSLAFEQSLLSANTSLAYGSFGAVLGVWAGVRYNNMYFLAEKAGLRKIQKDFKIK